MKSILLIFWLMFLGKTSSYENSTKGVEIRSTNQPGIYFEKLSNVRFISKHWKIVILMDVRVPKLELPVYRKHIEAIAEKANFLEANKTIIHQMRVQINRKFKQASEYMDTLRMKKRGLPSTVNIEDQKYYNQKIEYLNLSKDGITIDVERSVSMLNSTMENLCESQVGKDRELLGNLSKLLSITEDSAEISGSEFETSFEILMKLFDLRLDDYITAAQTIMENLNFIASYQKMTLILL